MVQEQGAGTWGQGVAVIYDDANSKFLTYAQGNNSTTTYASFTMGTTLAPVLGGQASFTYSPTTYVQRVRPPLAVDTTNDVVIIGYVPSGSTVVYSAVDLSGTNPALTGSPITSDQAMSIHFLNMEKVRGMDRIVYLQGFILAVLKLQDLLYQV